MMETEEKIQAVDAALEDPDSFDLHADIVQEALEHYRAALETELPTPWVVIDAGDQVLRCDRCGTTHPLADGVNHRPIWYATAIMRGFTKEHSECEE